MNADTAASSRWTQYTITKGHEKRAALVCIVCHSKKQKCDLQNRRRGGIRDCSSCARSGRACQPRQPKSRPKQSTVLGLQTATAADFQDLSSIDLASSDILPITPNSHEGAAVLFAGQMSADESGISSCQLRHESSSDTVAPNPACQTPQAPEIAESHRGDVDTGFLQVYAQETLEDATNQALKARPSLVDTDGHLRVSSELLDIYADTYFKDCYTWCPVLDRETLHRDLAKSPLLQNALAALGSNVRPPMLPHDGPATHYDRARRMFYEDEEPDNLTALRGILLFNWWVPRSSAYVHRHSSWWWTSTVIRHAQQMSMHRAPDSGQLNMDTNGVGRRVWWTAFSRERLTALCQSKPPIIDPRDCSVPAPSLDDFPLDSRNDPKATVFIYWVRLCAIIGRIASLLARTTTSTEPPSWIARELKDWIGALPSNIQVSLATRYVTAFDQDAYQLHIMFLIAVIILNLRRTREPGALPLVLPPAIMAASCVARIFKGILAKGDTRFLLPITSWFCGVSYITLLAASKDPMLKKAVLADMEIIVLMCDQLRKMWGSAEVIYHGFERLRAMAESNSRVPSYRPSCRASVAPRETALDDHAFDGAAAESHNPDWIDYFPFVSKETSKTVDLLLELRDTERLTSDSITWDPSTLDVRDWSDDLLNYTDLTFENDFLNSWTGG